VRLASIDEEAFAVAAIDRDERHDDAELARRCGVDRATLYQLEVGGIRSPLVSTVCKVARYFDTSVDALLAGTEPELPTPAA